MKRIIAFILAAVALTLCLTGCVYEELAVKLNKNETGSIAVTIGLEKSFVDQIAGDQEPFEGKETKEIEYNGKTYIAYTETTEYDSYDKIEKALSDLTYDTDTIEMFDADEIKAETETSENDIENNHIFKSVKIKNDGSKYIFDAVLNKVDGQVRGYSISDVFGVCISVEMPAKIIAYKNGTVDGKRISFNISDISEENELYVECKTASIVPVIVCGVLVAASIVAFFVIRKRK
jgi:hypothetical protein